MVMVMDQSGDQETRKGPWTEQEDSQLVCFVRLFGERRWDFIANVSGLNRTGKSCRLRWVNYLHPGLKRGRMTPQEERLILELHSRWGNRWSRIARRLPGRTDNEIKNYWRTHMRKKAQEMKKNNILSPSSSSSSLITCDHSLTSGPHFTEFSNMNLFQNGTLSCITSVCKAKENYNDESIINVYPIDQIWNEIEKSEAKTSGPTCQSQLESSPVDYCYNNESLFGMENELRKIFLPHVHQMGGLFC
ncbi:hypothetical protein LUZ60_015322 [Juncus effusus]|nr:hypothetical protein LUZ60_015322 [Juncus effusus]